MKLNLLPKFIIVMALISLLPMSFLGYMLIGIADWGVETATKESHVKMAEKITVVMGNFIEELNKNAAFLIQSFSKMDWENKRYLLASFIDSHKNVREVSVISAAGSEVMFSSVEGRSELANYSEDPFFKKCEEKNPYAFSLKRENERPLLDAYYYFGKGLRLRISVELDKIEAEISSARMGDTGFAVLMNSDRDIVIYPGEEEFSAGVEEVKNNKKIIDNALEARFLTSVDYQSLSGERFVGTYSPVHAAGRALGALIIRQSVEEVYEGGNYIRKNAMRIVYISIIVVFLAAYFMSRQLTRPIMKITESAERVSKGDFTRKVEINTGDELNLLADTFNRMMDQLKRYSDMQVEKIINEQRKVEAIMFSIDDGMIMTDYESRVQLMNRQAMSLLGIDDKATVGNKPITELVKNEKTRDILMAVLNNPGIDYAREIEFARGNITQYFKCFAMEVTTPRKKSNIGKIAVFHDITLDKQIMKIKDDFFHSITHDLRNPMGAIKGFIEFMLKEIPGPITEGQKKMLVSMDRASFRLLGMINNILDIAKMEAGKMEIKIEDFCISDAARKSLDLMESLGKRKNIKFSYEGDDDVKINGDPGLVERVFVNLLGNAIKFSRENGEITVGCVDEGESVLSWVKDTGDGIPEDYLDKVFAKFEQVKGQKAGGTGLGLTISKYVVDSHLGKIWVESKLGEGSRFLFRLPKKLKKNENGVIYA